MNINSYSFVHTASFRFPVSLKILHPIIIIYKFVILILQNVVNFLSQKTISVISSDKRFGFFVTHEHVFNLAQFATSCNRTLLMSGFAALDSCQSVDWIVCAETVFSGNLQTVSLVSSERKILSCYSMNSSIISVYQSYTTRMSGITVLFYTQALDKKQRNHESERDI